jgi:hypothetical protein
MVYRVSRAPLGEKLRRSAQRAGFSLKDMAIWLDRPYRRVQAWVSRDVTPRALDYEHVVLHVTLLNFAVKNKNLCAARRETRLEQRPVEIRRAYRAVRRAYSPRSNSSK